MTSFFDSGLISVLLENNTIEEFPESVKLLVEKLKRIENSKFISEMKENVSAFSEEEVNYLNNKFLDKLYECFKCIPPWEQAVKKGYLDVLIFMENHIENCFEIKEILDLASQYGRLEIVQKYFSEKHADLVVNNAIKNVHINICEEYEKYITSWKHKELIDRTPTILWDTNAVKFFLKKGCLAIENVLVISSWRNLTNNIELILENLEKDENFRLMVRQIFETHYKINNFYEKMAIQCIRKNILSLEFFLNHVQSCDIQEMSVEFFTFLVPESMENNGGISHVFLERAVRFENIVLARHVMVTFGINFINYPVDDFTCETLAFVLLNFSEKEYPVTYYKKYFRCFQKFGLFQKLADKSHFNYTIFEVNDPFFLWYAFDKYIKVLPAEKMEALVKKKFQHDKKNKTFFLEKLSKRQGLQKLKKNLSECKNKHDDISRNSK